MHKCIPWKHLETPPPSLEDTLPAWKLGLGINCNLIAMLNNFKNYSTETEYIASHMSYTLFRTTDPC